MAAKIEAVRKLTPPLPETKARNDHASKKDFAAQLGASLATVNRWTSGKGYPEEGFQEKLAELSGGTYQPEDFARPAAKSEAVPPEELEAEVVRLARGLRRLTRRVQALERQARLEAGEGQNHL